MSFINALGDSVLPQHSPMPGVIIDDTGASTAEDAPRRSPRYALFLLVLFTAYNTLDSADRTVLAGSFESVGAFLREDLHTTATDAAFGSLTSAFIVGFSVSAVLVGQLAARWPHLNLIIVAVGVLEAGLSRRRVDLRPHPPPCLRRRSSASCGASACSSARPRGALEPCSWAGPCRGSARRRGSRWSPRFCTT